MRAISWREPDAAAAPRGRIRQVLARIGSVTRGRASFVLVLAAVALGVARAAFRPRTWRRTVRMEFRRALRHALGGGVATVLVTASLVGLTMVYQALYWFGEVGQEGLVGPILVQVLIREVAPVLVGLILLGRSGTVVLVELGSLQAAGDIRALEAQGLDPFLLVVLPCACAFVLAAFTLSMIFVTVALIAGFVVGSFLEVVRISIWTFLDQVLLAMRTVDFVVFPAKTVVIGLVVALAACLTGLSARPRSNAARLLPSGFVRGVVAILLVNGALSLAV